MTYGRHPILAKPRMAQVKVILYFGTIEVVILKDNFFNLAGILKVLSDQMGWYLTTVLSAWEGVSRNSLQGNGMWRIKHAVVG